MKARVYCLASPKGGSGKTIITANFATFLTVLGKKCLIIDCDSATHGLTLLYLHKVTEKVSANKTKKPSGVFDGKPLDIKDDVIQVENGVDFLPATYNFEIFEKADENSFIKTLQNILEATKNNYDYIFLDAQAGSDTISRAAMAKEVSDEVIIVSEYDPLSAAGIERLKNIIGNDLEFTRTWILLNKMLPEFVEKFSDFLSVVRYLTPIPWNADVVRSYARKRLAINTEYGNEFTLSIIQTLKSLIGGKIIQEIDAWADRGASNIRQPLETQYSDSELELVSLFKYREQLKSRQMKTFILKCGLQLMTKVFVPLIAFFTVYDSINLIFNQIYSTIESKKPVNGYEIIVSLVLIAIAVVAVFVVNYLFSRRIGVSSKSEDRVEEKRLNRQIEVLEERLKKLEVLKKADFKTLVKQCNE